MMQRFEQTLRRHQLVRDGDTVLAAVSGGADSVAMLHLLARLAPVYPFKLVAAHLDHALRPESRDDADFVRALCDRMETPLVSARVDVSAEAKRTGTGIEEAGRDVRRRFLQQSARDRGCGVVALAHHADDQAETVLFRLVRGSGLSGLSAMRYRSGIFIRPLLDVRRADLEEYLREQGLSWRDDASNRDPAFARNRIRHRVLPELAPINPQAVEALCRLARQAGDEEAFWVARGEEFLQAHGARTRDGDALDIDAIASRTRGERRRLLRAFLAQGRGHLAGIDAGHIDAVDELLFAERPQAELHLPGLWVARRYGRLLCSATSPDIADYCIRIDGPGEYRLPTGDVLAFSGDADQGEDRTSVVFSGDRLAFPFVVRPPRAGDRFQPSGMSGRKLVKDYFIDARVDRETRRRTPVVCHDETIIWLAGERRCEGFRPVPGENVLRITHTAQKLSLE